MRTRLRELRDARGESQKETAAAIGLSQQGYGAYEVGTREAGYSMLRALSEHFGVSVDYIIGNTDTLVPVETDSARAWATKYAGLSQDDDFCRYCDLYMQMTDRQRVYALGWLCGWLKDGGRIGRP